MAEKPSPVLIVGLPRSGSTLLSWLLNQSSDLLALNDLYFLQAVMAKKLLHRPLEIDHIRALTRQIMDLVTERSSNNPDFIGQIRIDPAKLRDIEDIILQEGETTGFTWDQLMDGVLSRLTAAVEKKRWADKTPQNFLHLNILNRVFPGSSVLFLFRHPYDVLASYKFAVGTGHDRRRYHPVIYALYWRSSVRSYLDCREKHAQTAMITYEEIINDTIKATEKLNTFLRTDIPQVDISQLADNSSFQGERTAITSLEKIICWKICRKEMQILGYPASRKRVRSSDFFELTFLSLQFLFFQTGKFISSRDARKRMSGFAHRIMAGRAEK